jgi:hypothetical protein
MKNYQSLWAKVCNCIDSTKIRKRRLIINHLIWILWRNEYVWEIRMTKNNLLWRLLALKWSQSYKMKVIWNDDKICLKWFIPSINYDEIQLKKCYSQEQTTNFVSSKQFFIGLTLGIGYFRAEKETDPNRCRYIYFVEGEKCQKGK